MTFKIILNGASVHHNGSRVGQHGITEDGKRVFVDYSDPLYDEMAFTLSVDILKNLNNVDLIAFRDKSHDLTLFDVRHFYQPLNGSSDKDHYILEPERYNMDDRQVAVKMWNNMKVFESQGDQFKLASAKYGEMESM